MHNKRLGYLVKFFILVASFGNALKGAEYTPPPSPVSDSESKPTVTFFVKNKKYRHHRRDCGLGSLLNEPEEKPAVLKVLVDTQSTKFSKFTGCLKFKSK